jgi:putative ABC transport system ATP-binding protein
MATLSLPKVLLLDEHTASLDPKTATVVMDLTERVIKENRLTTLMVTHNMEQAIRYGSRLVMMHEGKIILDVSGKEKSSLTIPEVVQRFGVVDEKLLLA